MKIQDFLDQNNASVRETSFANVLLKEHPALIKIRDQLDLATSSLEQAIYQEKRSGRSYAEFTAEFLQKAKDKLSMALGRISEFESSPFPVSRDDFLSLRGLLSEALGYISDIGPKENYGRGDSFVQADSARANIEDAIALAKSVSTKKKK